MVWQITLVAPPARMDDVYCIPSPNTPIGCTHEGYSMLTSGWRHHSSTNCPSWPSSSLRRWVSFPGVSTTAATVSCGKNIECSMLEPPGPLAWKRYGPGRSWTNPLISAALRMSRWMFWSCNPDVPTVASCSAFVDLPHFQNPRPWPQCRGPPLWT